MESLCEARRRAESGAIDHARPATYGQCDSWDVGDGNGPTRLGIDTPCPFVGCKHHLYLDRAMGASFKINFPDLDFDELDQTCALRVADATVVREDERGVSDRTEDHITLLSVGQLLNLTRERVRQMQIKALAKIRPAAVRIANEGTYAGPARCEPRAPTEVVEATTLTADGPTQTLETLGLWVAREVDADGEDEL